MPTDKPRFTITVDDELYKLIDDFKFQNRCKNQTQAVITLLESGLKTVQKELSANKNTSKPTLHEEDLLKKYRVLKDHGKKIVDMVLEEEYQHYLATQQNVVPYAAMGGGGVITKDQAERDLCEIDNDTKDLED